MTEFQIANDASAVTVEMLRSYDELLEALKKDVDEEIGRLCPLVDDEDASCPARDLRAERLAAFEHIRRLLTIYEDWEW